MKFEVLTQSLPEMLQFKEEQNPMAISTRTIPFMMDAIWKISHVLAIIL